MPGKPSAHVGATTPDDDWTTASEGSRTRLIFEDTGDTYTGTYDGPESITDPETGEEMKYLNFTTTAPGTSDTEIGEITAVSRSYSLDKAFSSNIPVGAEVRLTLKKVTASKRGNPFKDYLVQWRPAG